MSDKTVKITDENFDELVINSKKLVIVDFWNGFTVAYTVVIGCVVAVSALIRPQGSIWNSGAIRA